MAIFVEKSYSPEMLAAMRFQYGHGPLSSELGTDKTGKVVFWPWLSGNLFQGVPSSLGSGSFATRFLDDLPWMSHPRFDAWHLSKEMAPVTYRSGKLNSLLASNPPKI